MGCGVYWNQIREIESAMSTLRKYNVLESSDAYQKLVGIRSRLLRNVGLKFPRGINQILKLIGLSPGSLTLWHDLEGGWLVEAREDQSSPPVYHYVSGEIASILINGGLTHDLEAQLMTPDLYLGE